MQYNLYDRRSRQTRRRVKKITRLRLREAMIKISTSVRETSQCLLLLRELEHPNTTRCKFARGTRFDRLNRA